MAATLSDLLTRVRTVLRDETGDFVDDDDIIAWLNEAYTDIVSRTRALQSEKTGTTSAGNTIAFPAGADPELYNSFSLALAGEEVTFVDNEVWEHWRDEGGDPGVILARIWNRNFELFPTPTTGTAYTLRYEQLPPPLVTGDDQHLLPGHLERKLIEYARAQAKYKDGEPAMGDRYLGMYEEGLPPGADGRARLHGPMNASFVGSWADEDIDAQHI
jgi:uncharacterized protein DUF6682